MKRGHFFAILSRMKYINRWGLMRCLRTETLSEHTLDTVYISHALALIHNARCGGGCDPARTALLAAYHDCAEIFTGDLPTPVKYKTAQLRNAYRAVEDSALRRLAASVPEELEADYMPYLKPREDCIEYRLMKAADKISAFLKCREETDGGNGEFTAAQNAQLRAIEQLGLPAADIFMKEYSGFYSRSIDALAD